eukprot:scaffold88510_cov32-Phaeocystis_antarctica.AAC.1
MQCTCTCGASCSAHAVHMQCTCSAHDSILTSAAAALCGAAASDDASGAGTSELAPPLERGAPGNSRSAPARVR